MENLQDASKLAIGQAVLDGGFPPSDYKDGTANDIVQVAKLGCQPEWPLETLKLPTLILHGTRDIIVRFGAAKFHAERIPGAQLVAYKGGTHFIGSTYAKDVGLRIEDFLGQLS